MIMSKRLLIIGAGGFGREVLVWALRIPEEERVWSVVAFLDANPNALDGYGIQTSIAGNPATYQPDIDDLLVPALGDPVVKLRVSNDLKARGGQFITLVLPEAGVGDRCVVGDGCVICSRVVLTADVTVGDFVTMNVSSGAGHDSVIGNGCTLSGHVDLMGFTTLGEGVFLGSHAVVLPGVSIGDYAKIGAGSVVIRNVAAGTTVFGVPARKIS